MGGRELLPENHALNIAFDPSTGLFSCLRLSTVDSSKSSAEANSRKFGASLLKMEIPATFSKRSSALMLKWSSGNEVTVEMKYNVLQNNSSILKAKTCTDSTNSIAPVTWHIYAENLLQYD